MNHPINSDMKTLANDTTALSGPLTGVNICVIGGGFVGCVTAAGFAKFGHNVICIEKDIDRLKKLQKGQLPFFERDLEDLIKSNLKSGRLQFDDNLDSAVENQKAVFITVGTPSGESGRADLSALEEVIETLSKKMTPEQIIVLKSTVPIGTADRLKELLKTEKKENGEIPIINNPEFLREGSAVYDFFYPQRIVIGGENSEAIDTIKQIHRFGMTESVPIITTNNKTAEMIKYASNTFLATKIGFINEIARLCDNVGIDVQEVARAMGNDTRIGSEFLNPGPGWGGSCLPKDLKEFIALAGTYDVSLNILPAVNSSNIKQHEYVVSRVKKLLGSLKGKRIAALGLAFKAETNDLRDSPALYIIKKLIYENAIIRAFDPAVNTAVPEIPEQVKLVPSALDAVSNADCVLILTEWPEFQLLDWENIGQLVKQKILFDTRNLLTSELLEKHGFKYASMGHI